MSIEDVAALRLEGWSWDKIAEKYGLTRHQLRCEYVPGYAEMYRRRYILKNEAHRSPLREEHRAETQLYIPPDVIEERERRTSLTPRDNTAAMLGDPLPGYSALDRRGAREQRTSQAVFQPLPVTLPVLPRSFASDVPIAPRQRRYARRLAPSLAV